MRHRAGREKTGQSGKRRKRDGFVAEPPLGLIVGAIALGMLVGALLAPAAGGDAVVRSPLSLLGG